MMEEGRDERRRGGESRVMRGEEVEWSFGEGSDWGWLRELAGEEPGGLLGVGPL